MRLQGRRTVVGLVAQLLDDGQVPADSVQAVNVQTCRADGRKAVTATTGPATEPTTPATGGATSSLHRLHTLLHKTRDRRPLLRTQRRQVAAKDVVCRGSRR